MKTFTKNQLLVGKASSKDAGRHALNGILVEGNKTIATNGHILIMNENLEKTDPWELNGVQWEVDKWLSHIEEIDETPFIISNEAVKKALKNFPKVKKYDHKNRSRMAIGQSKSSCVTDMSAITMQNSDNDKIESQAVDGKFPDYKRVIPDTTDYIKVGVNATYLKQICEVLEKSGNGNIVLNFKKEDTANHPIVIENIDQCDEKITSVLMPVRL
jgi:DNA polymerase III sliding clamp (beta) subunit (PCNA family)